MPQNISQKFLAQDQAANPGRGLTLAAKLLTQSWSLDLPVAAGTQGQSLRAIVGATSSDIQLEWYTPTSIADTAVGANLVYAGPDEGYPENPTFRALTPGDIPALSAGKITSGIFSVDRLPVGSGAGEVAAGDDPRFHTQNTDTSTTSPTFKLDSTGSGLIIKSTLTGFEFRNASDTDYADFRAGNVVTGNEVNIGDNKILLNSDVLTTATPTEDGGISLNRGSQAAAELVWNEAEDSWQAGIVNEMFVVVRRKLFVIGTTGVSATYTNMTFEHNFGSIVSVTCMLPDRFDFIPASIQYTDEVTIIDFGGITVTGEITVRLDG